MIRIAVTLLVVLQAVLPPGMCLCWLVPHVATARPELGSVPTSPTSTANEPCCTCTSCRVAHTPTTTPTGEQTAKGHETQSDLPAPLPVPPAPCSGCPTVTAGPEAQAAILTGAEQTPTDTAIYLVFLTDEVIRPRVERPRPVPASAATPLFVRYRALLI